MEKRAERLERGNARGDESERCVLDAPRRGPCAEPPLLRAQRCISSVVRRTVPLRIQRPSYREVLNMRVYGGAREEGRAGREECQSRVE